MVYSKVSKKATAVEELLTTPPPSPSHGRQFSHRVHHCAVCKKVATDRCLETCRAWRCESHPLTIIMRGYDCLACKGKEIAEERKRKEELAKANTELVTTTSNNKKKGVNKRKLSPDLESETTPTPTHPPNSKKGKKGVNKRKFTPEPESERTPTPTPTQPSDSKKGKKGVNKRKLTPEPESETTPTPTQSPDSKRGKKEKS
ncbi:hypothetical protein EDC01DRAFT_632342 [Geopyxis carbonaria]|nr:hypothetical protein EDC01DRAFT_632342 [Geopyxis carbonaria]